MYTCRLLSVLALIALALSIACRKPADPQRLIIEKWEMVDGGDLSVEFLEGGVARVANRKGEELLTPKMGGALNYKFISHHEVELGKSLVFSVDVVGDVLTISGGKGQSILLP